MDTTTKNLSILAISLLLAIADENQYAVRIDSYIFWIVDNQFDCAKGNEIILTLELGKNPNYSDKHQEAAIFIIKYLMDIMVIPSEMATQEIPIQNNNTILI